MAGTRDTLIGAEVIAEVAPHDRATIVGAEYSAAVKNNLRTTIVGVEYIVRLARKPYSYGQVVS